MLSHYTFSQAEMAPCFRSCALETQMHLAILSLTRESRKSDSLHCLAQRSGKKKESVYERERAISTILHLLLPISSATCCEQCERTSNLQRWLLWSTWKRFFFFFQNTVTNTQDNKHPFHLWFIQGNKVFQFISDGRKCILNGTGHREVKATNAATG